MKTPTKEITSAYLKIDHLGIFVDLGEFDGSNDEIKTFLDGSIEILLTQDPKVKLKYRDFLDKSAENYKQEMLAKINNTKTRIKGFGK